MRFSNIVVLTGAGLSAESGLGTFRDKGGLWEEFDLEAVATPGGFARDPARVHEFYNLRRARLGTAKPNAAHVALARLERDHRGEVLTVTQNIDQLHEAAGTKKLIHMHGELARVFCAACEASVVWAGDLSTETACASCGKEGAMRPDVVWFGEMPREMNRSYAALHACDLFISVGTSGSVYPAASVCSEPSVRGGQPSRHGARTGTGRLARRARCGSRRQRGCGGRARAFPDCRRRRRAAPHPISPASPLAQR